MPVEVRVRIEKDKAGKEWLVVSIPYAYLDAVFRRHKEKGSSREASKVSSPSANVETSSVSPPSIETRKEEPNDALEWYRFEIRCRNCGYKTWLAGTKRSLNYWKCGCGSTEFDILKEERL